MTDKFYAVPEGQTIRVACAECGETIDITEVRHDACATAPRIADLEGALDDALEEIRQLRAWRERAWDAMREAGLEARDIMRRLDLEPTPGSE